MLPNVRQLDKFRFAKLPLRHFLTAARHSVNGGSTKRKWPSCGLETSTHLAGCNLWRESAKRKRGAASRRVTAQATVFGHQASTLALWQGCQVSQWIHNTTRGTERWDECYSPTNYSQWIEYAFSRKGIGLWEVKAKRKEGESAFCVHAHHHSTWGTERRSPPYQPNETSTHLDDSGLR